MSGSILSGIGRTIYQLGFEISPIIFADGIASEYSGYLPIIVITEGPNLITRLLSGGNPLDLDNFFAHFAPLPGGALASYSIGQYPFANQAVAANAIIAEPLTISFKMMIPVNKRGGHTAKLVTMMMLQSAIQNHANRGGTYILATPAGFYTGCILSSMTDISDQSSPTPQNTWKLDFVKPLVSLQSAQAAQSSLMSKLTSGLPTDGSFASAASSASVPSVIGGTSATGMNPISGGVGGAGL